MSELAEDEWRIWSWYGTMILAKTKAQAEKVLLTRYTIEEVREHDILEMAMSAIEKPDMNCDAPCIIVDGR